MVKKRLRLAPGFDEMQAIRRPGMSQADIENDALLINQTMQRASTLPA